MNINKKPARYAEDGFDLERTKRNMNNVTIAKRRNRRLNLLIKAGKFVMLILSLAVFLFLFNLAMEVMSLI
jgi:hypothetical protein